MKTKPDIITLQPRIPALDETANPLFVTNSLPLTSLIQLPELAAVVGRGFEKASLIQEQSYAHLLGGKPAILGAETGSGKTLAYFLPLLDRYVTKQMEQKQAALLAAAQAAPAPQGGSEAQETQEAAWVQQQDPLPGPVDVIKYGIIMAPTAPLCDQIMSMVSDIVTELRDKGLPVRISRWTDTLNLSNRTKSLANTEPHLSLVVCTPKTLFEAFRKADVTDATHPFRLLQFMVLDEADMLLSGSYLTDMEKVLEMLKLVRRAQVRDGSVKVNDKPVQYVLSAATIPTQGKKSIDVIAKDAFPHITYIRTGHMHTHHPAIRQDFIKFADKDLLTAHHITTIMEHLQRLDPAYQETSATTTTAAEGAADWMRSVDYSTMIFLNTAAGAQKFASLLREQGYECTELHALIDKSLRYANLKAFRENACKIAVCTDACARGFDLPQVRRVVQAEFALNVVHHLHRIGRASRGGRQGAAINLYGERNYDLVECILGAAEGQAMEVEEDSKEGEEDESKEGEEGAAVEKKVKYIKTPIEASFSRRRGFRKQINRAAKEEVEGKRVKQSNSGKKIESN